MLTKKNGKDGEALTAVLPAATDLAAPRTEAQPQSVRWHFSVRGIAIRLFLTCWIIYALHFATNIVREIFPALSLGDHLSFRVDEYAHMHPDLFEKPGYGWHIGNNPGVSMLAAIPYALARPIIDPIVASVNQKRRALGLNEPPNYNSPWPMAREFYAEAWRRGYDIKFGLAALVMQTLAMAPVSALTAVVMFILLRSLFRSDKIALGLSLLYAFGTPVFFRTGYLNHNLMLGEFAFMGLLALWNPWNSQRWSLRTRYLLGGLAGGTAILFDYSGAVLLLGLFLYGVLKQWREATRSEAIRYGIWYIVGTLAPVALLWFYQWNSFGNPFLPGQHWMPPVEWSNLGYQGYGLPQLDLFAMLGFDYRFGFFTSSPLMLLALAAPFVDRGLRRVLPRMELWAMLGFFFAFWVFFSGSNYTRLEFNTGVRYMSAMFPFMFVPAAVVLMRLPRFAIAAIAILSFVEAWPLAMYRDVERGLGLLEPVLHVFSGGFQLPWLTTLSRMGNNYGDYFANGVSPLPIFMLTAAVLFVIWSPQIWSAGRQAGQVVNIPVGS